MSASNGTKAGTTHLAVTTTQQGNRRSRTTPHKERMSGLVKHPDYHPHSYIVNERYNSRNKRASQERKNSEWQAPVTIAQPQTLTQGGHSEIACLLNKNEQNFFIFTYDETNKDKLGK